MRNFGSASQYTTAGIYTKIQATVSSHLRALAVMVLMILFGGAAWGQTPLTGNINWTTSTHNKTYKLASCDAAYTITKSSSTADVNGSFMNFQLPDGAADNGCKIKITMEDCDMAAYNGLFNRQRDKLTLTSNGVSNAEWYESGGLWVFTDEPIGAEFEGGIGQDVKITLTNSSSGFVGTSWWKISVTCTGCCDLDAEIVVDNP